VFERFHQDARKAVITGRDEAVRVGQSKIGCEHLLLGLLAAPGPASAAMTAAGLNLAALRGRLSGGQAEPDTMDARALASVGIDLDEVRRAVDGSFGPGALDRAGLGRPRRPGRMPFTPDAKKALELSARAMQRFRDRELTGGHLLLGVIDQGHNGALALLAESGVDAARLRRDVLSRLTAAA
jgi:ATP-dependent Clp protease ATP-binding subunit ClpA